MKNRKTIAAEDLYPGLWIVYSNPRINQRVVDVGSTRDGQIKVPHDYGNGGEPFLKPWTNVPRTSSMTLSEQC